MNLWPPIWILTPMSKNSCSKSLQDHISATQSSSPNSSTNKHDLSYVTESTDDEQWHQIKVWAFRDYSTSMQLGSDLLNIFLHWVRKPCTLQCRLKCSRRDCRCLSGCHRSKPQRFRSASTLPCIMYWPRVIIGTFWSFLRLLYFLVLFVSRRMSQVETTVAEISQRECTSLYCALATTGHRSPASHTVWLRVWHIGGGTLCGAKQMLLRNVHRWAPADPWFCVQAQQPMLVQYLQAQHHENFLDNYVWKMFGLL